MRDPARIARILALVESLWVDYPDFRLTQLLLSAVGIHKGVSEDFFYADDDVVEAALINLRAMLTKPPSE